MGFLDSKSIRTKLVVSFATMFVLAVLLGGFAAWRLAVLGQDTAAIQGNVNGLVPLALLSQDANKLVAMSNTMVNLIDRQHEDALNDQAQLVARDGEAQWAAYSPDMDPGQETQDGNKLHDAYETIQHIFAKDYQLTVSNAIGTSDNGLGDAAAAFNKAMAADLAYQQAQATQISAAATAARASGFAGIAVALGIMALLSAGVVAILLRSVSSPIASMTGAMRRLAAHDMAVEVPGIGRGDEIGAMAAAVQIFKENAQERAKLEAAAVEFQKNLDAKLRETEAAFAEAGRDQKLVVETMAASLAALAQGDLTARFTATVSHAYEGLKRDFNAALGNLQATMQSVATNMQAVRSGAGEITHSSDDLSRRTEQQAASLEQTAAALAEITETVRKTAQGATTAREVVNEAKQDAEQSGRVVNDTVAAMTGIENSSKQIANIIGVIDEIAFQTNLLALNAGVEAARAGDAGRGFAVVATEVRALAQRSADAAKEIKSLISASGAQVATGVKLVGETGRALARIVEQVNRLNLLVADIAGSAQEQATALNEVNGAVNQMDQVTQKNAAMVEETTAASHALAAEAEELARLVAQFRMGEAPAAAPQISRPAQRRAAVQGVYA